MRYELLLACVVTLPVVPVIAGVTVVPAGGGDDLDADRSALTLWAAGESEVAFHGVQPRDVRLVTQITLGRDRALIVASSSRDGVVLGYVRGRRVAERRGGDIRSLQVVDVDGDGVLEAVVDETHLYGTGVMSARAVVLRLENAGLAVVWEGITERSLVPWPGGAKGQLEKEGKQGFLSFWHSNEADLLYVVHDLVRGSWHETGYRWDGTRLVQR